MTNSIPKPEHPRPDWQRADWYNLNGPWGFAFGEADNPPKQEPETWERSIQVPYSWASPLSGIFEDKKGGAWYGRRVSWQPARPIDGVLLHFGAVDYACRVYVNGQDMGGHAGGYGPFSLEVTAAWQRDGSNLLLVWAEDTDEAWQARGKQGYGEIRGIWQTPYLEARPDTYLESLRFYPSMKGEIRVKGSVSAVKAEEAVLDLSFDHGVSEAFPLSLQAGMNEFEFLFAVPNPKLWSPETPFLYEGSAAVIGGQTDTVSTYFGIREIGTVKREDKECRWITLNGKPLYLNGTLDQAFHPEGFFTYPSDQEIQEEIWRLKRLGLNFVRIHIKPEEPRKLYWADKLGILIMEDLPCFWGAPDAQARASYTREAQEILKRDFNHPSIFSWVLFNETWGLFTATGEGKNQYLPETQAWVLEMLQWAKAEDPTRLIEDNSACNYDHLKTDINTWHFYINGYEPVRDHIAEVAEKTFPGSPFNYVPGYVQCDAPLMNSECGNVWGIEGSAGDSDIAWHYQYMLNEFRRHDKICGFVFTEFHDVVNEFNGYYRIDNGDKDFGYDWFCPGMTLADLHSPDYIGVDGPPCQTAACSAEVSAAPFVSSFQDKHHGQPLTLAWTLWFDGLGTRMICQRGSQDFVLSDYGTAALPEILLRMPDTDALAVLSLTLLDASGEVIARNFTTYDVQSGEGTGRYPLPGMYLSVSPAAYVRSGFEHAWSALSGHKANGAGAGFFEYEVRLPEGCGLNTVRGIELYFEASAKQVYEKDIAKDPLKKQLLNFMHGDRHNPGTNPNSYFMTDEQRHPAKVQVCINGIATEALYLPDDPADSRGVLSWHYQQEHRHLEEAGSYGYLQRITVPSRAVADCLRTKKLTLTLKAQDAGGLALYGRNAGRYPLDILVRLY